ncbi:MAG: hypothetical protein ACKO3R_01925 [bacterium]
MQYDSSIVAKGTSSKLRRTNDRSVISSDAEDATPVSYASKRKYKLRLPLVHVLDFKAPSHQQVQDSAQ